MISHGVSFLKRWRAHPFVRQISGMMLLTIAGQGIYLIAGPFIGRIYTPEQIGLYGLFMTIFMMLGLYACGLYDLAIPAVNDDDEAGVLSDASLFLGVLIALASGAVLTIFIINGFLGLGSFPRWMGLMMAAGMIAHTNVLIGQAWAVRNNDVLRIGRSNVTMNALRGGLQVLGGLFAPLWGVMAVSEIAARIAQSRQVRRRRIKQNGDYSRASLQAMASAIRRNKRYPTVFGPSFALDSMATLVQTATIGMMFGAAEMGQYFLMRRTLDLPVAFAFKSLSDVFFARQIVIVRDAPERLRPFFVKSAAGLAIAGGLVSLPLLVFGPELFKLFFGPAWGTAGSLAAIMVVPTALNLAVAPVARVFQLSRWAQLRVVPGVINLIGSLLVLWLAQAHNLSLIQVTIGISIVIGLQYCIYFGAGYLASSRLVDTDDDSFDRGE